MAKQSPHPERFDHRKVDTKWQKHWQNSRRYAIEDPPIKGKKAYVLDMFPYPSGEGLHVGHPLGYIGSDILARYQRARGKTVLHPMGWDAFGLPAENYAIKTGTHPTKTTARAIDRFREQLQRLGLSYDWNREVNTSRPSYYRWTQWLFLKLYEKGVAYRAKAPVNWCESCQTVLANEQVKDGRCDRCDSEVIQKELEQWFFKITAYADELLAAIDDLDWPEPIKLMQRNWIGRSEGTLINFPVKDMSLNIEVYSTRPDTLFGSTFLVLAPEHPHVQELMKKLDNTQAVEKYVRETKTKSDLERGSQIHQKTGIKLEGVIALNPANQAQLPIYIADFVLADYGTGAIMGVPAHDERDYEFARTFDLPIIPVVEVPIALETLLLEPKTTSIEFLRVFTGDGHHINSEFLNGLKNDEAIEKMTSWLEANQVGHRRVAYRLRDWLVSRQRYWGAPIPMIICQTCGYVPVPENNLPVLLPTDVDFKPTGQSPLVDSKTFHEGVTCTTCGKPARREVDTMDTFVDSSWYFLRFADPTNTRAVFDSNIVKQWLPVDWYVGGAEHAVLHLLYARFFTKFLADCGLLAFREPFTRLRNQGLIMGEDNRKMSKRWGNVINPDDVVRDYGADALRCFEMFMGPFEDSKPWSTQGLVGVRRWLERVFRLQSKYRRQKTEDIPSRQGRAEAGKQSNERVISRGARRVLHETIQKITKDIEDFHFNTAISQLMICTNFFEKEPNIDRASWQAYLQIMAPFAPHLANELWEQANFSDSPEDSWPMPSAAVLSDDDEISIPVQVNGKLRGQLSVARSVEKEATLAAARELPSVKSYLHNRHVVKTVYVPGRIINFVVQ